MCPSKLTAEVWPITDAGLADANQDAVLIYQPADAQLARYAGSLYIVADGNGGGQQGQLASYYATRKVMHAYFSSDEPDLGLRLREAVQAANADLYNYARQRPELVKLSTTLVAMALRGEEAHIAAAGNSRAYLIRDGQIRQITRDHTLVQQLLDEGAITPEEALNHPRRDVLLRALGVQETVVVEVFDLRLQADDVILLCTDGLTGVLSDEEIAQIAATASPRSAAVRLVESAKERGTKDNVTVLAALLRDGAPPLTEAIPHTWDGLPPTFDVRPTLAVPQAARPEPPAPPTQESRPTTPLDETIRARPVAREEVWQPAGDEEVGFPPDLEAGEELPVGTSLPPTPPEGVPAPQPPRPAGPVPAPAFQQPVQPAPQYGVPPAQRGVPPGYQPPPGYAIDPATGLPPVPSGQPLPPTQPGWTGPQPVGGYSPRVYQPPATPHLRPRQQQGIPVGTFAVVGLLTVLLTVVMVVLLVNPMGWELPFGPGRAATGPVAGQTVASPTQPIVTQPPTAIPTPTATIQPLPTAPIAPPGMVLIEGGPFTRGVSDEEVRFATNLCINETVDDPERQASLCILDFFTDAQPVEEVTLSPFFMDVTEVTNQAYAGCVNAGICTPPVNTEFFDDPNFAQHPVVYVTWEQARQYCEWAGKRLPTEAEWEKAARWDPATGQSLVYPWGNQAEVGIANTISAGLGGLSAVGAFPRDLSPSGVLDMAGNASEWVADWYFESYTGLGTLNPTGPATYPYGDTAYRVVRGGSFLELNARSRAGHRFTVRPQSAVPWLGFRCAADVAGAVPPQPTPTVTPAPVEATPAVTETPAP